MFQMNAFLRSTEIIDWEKPEVLRLAKSLATGSGDELVVARQCFEWVRDNIKHSCDYRLNPVTCTASEVLAEGTGFCYAKSHLLAALLRANSIPAGLCYQRLSLDDHGDKFCLHGLNAAFLRDFGWHRLDPRGNKPGVDAQFVPPQEQLAFPIRLKGEMNLPEVWPEPLNIVVQALRSHRTFDSLAQHLPDVPLIGLG